MASLVATSPPRNDGVGEVMITPPLPGQCRWMTWHWTRQPKRERVLSWGYPLSDYLWLARSCRSKWG